MKPVTDAQIIEAWGKFKSATKVAKYLGYSAPRALYDRLKKLRAAGAKLECADKRSPYFGESEVWGHWQNLDKHPGVISLSVHDGHVLVGSDAHYWPGIIATAHRAFVEFAKEFQPKAVIMNGDDSDFPKISRHAAIGWEERPDVADEIEAVQERRAEIEKAAPNAKRPNPLGNHDGRFETRLASVAPEFARVHGVHLKDHFPLWQPCWMVEINRSVIVKHRMRGGEHATSNNTKMSGRTTVTGHLHSLQVRPFTDYDGTRWGVDTGTMADPYGPQFYNYTEVGPLNWRSGFVLLTFHKGELLDPETIRVKGPGEVVFRGKVHRA